MEDFNVLKKTNYGKNICTQMEGGVIFFDPDSLKEVVGAGAMTYDEYLDVQFQSMGKMRSYFEMCYFNFAMEFKGQIERVTKNNVCFERVFVSGMYSDGEMFDGKVDHVWLDKSGFDSYHIGECVTFYADVYRYVKTSNGKLIDYSLRNPKGIKKIAPYELPSDDDLIKQGINQIICETCFWCEQCNRVFCMRDFKERKILQEQMFEAVKGKTPDEQVALEKMEELP